MESRDHQILGAITDPYTHATGTDSFTFRDILLTFVFMPKCPTCGKAADWKDNEWRPFCSERCKTRDLGAWAAEEYRVSGETPDDETETPPAQNET